MQHLFASATFLLSVTACQSGAVAENNLPPQSVLQSRGTAGTFKDAAVEVVTGKTVSERFLPTAGYTRVAAAPASFAYYLGQLSCKPAGTPVKLFNGEEKQNQRGVAAVLDLDAGKTDLQQCADAVMRLRAEYLFANGRTKDIHFHFTNGFKADFFRWSAGSRIAVSGNNVSWQQGAAEPDSSYKSLRQYLDKVFTYAGTLSLQKELQPFSIDAIQAGDVLIQGGSPGHAMIVVEVAQNATGQRAFMLAQSYMPAQDIHIVKNPQNNSPWFSVAANSSEIRTPDWTFSTSNLRRFEGE
jgi:hypothetical protein